MSVHTQGDRTIDMVLDQVEEHARQDYPRAKITASGWSIAHSCAATRSTAPSGSVCFAASFINHITHWGAPIEDALFGPERAAHYMPVGSALASRHADQPARRYADDRPLLPGVNEGGHDAAAPATGAAWARASAWTASPR